MRSTATPPSHKICLRLFPSSYTGRVGDALGRWPVHRFRLNRPCHHDHIVPVGCLRWKNPGPGYALRSPKRGVDGLFSLAITDYRSWRIRISSQRVSDESEKSGNQPRGAGKWVRHRYSKLLFTNRHRPSLRQTRNIRLMSWARSHGGWEEMS